MAALKGSRSVEFFRSPMTRLPVDKGMTGSEKLSRTAVCPPFRAPCLRAAAAAGTVTLAPNT